MTISVAGAQAQARQPDQCKDQLLASADGVIARWVRGPAVGFAVPIHGLEYDLRRWGTESLAAAAMPVPDSVARSVAKRQAEYVYGRLCAQASLRALGMDARWPALGRSGQPVWPEGVIGSITHCEPYAAAVAVRAQQGGVGIDVERVIAAEQLSTLLSVVDPVELALLQQLRPRLSLATGLTLVFSAKESLYKAVFPSVGTFLDFDCAKLCGLNPEQGWLELRLAKTLCRNLPAGTRLPVRFVYLRSSWVLTALYWAG